LFSAMASPYPGKCKGAILIYRQHRHLARPVATDKSSGGKSPMHPRGYQQAPVILERRRGLKRHAAFNFGVQNWRLNILLDSRLSLKKISSTTYHCASGMLNREVSNACFNSSISRGGDQTLTHISGNQGTGLRCQWSPCCNRHCWRQ
jgi:hypothetical protein